MNYDLTDIPAAYDRGRDLEPATLALWMRTLQAHLPADAVKRILDLGCGTGRFSEPLSRHFATEVIGVDPSAKMLARAVEKRRERRGRYVRGAAEMVPLSSHSVGVVFMSMSFHHFPDPNVAARECGRVLRDNGRIFVRTGTRDEIDAYPYVEFFPTTRPMLEDTLPSRDALRNVFETAGLQLVKAELVTQTVAPNWGAYADRLGAGGDSIIARLSRQALDAGLAKIRRYGETSTEPVVEPIDLFVFRSVQ